MQYVDEAAFADPFSGGQPEIDSAGLEFQLLRSDFDRIDAGTALFLADLSAEAADRGYRFHWIAVRPHEHGIRKNPRDSLDGEQIGWQFQIPALRRSGPLQNLQNARHVFVARRQILRERPLSPAWNVEQCRPLQIEKRQRHQKPVFGGVVIVVGQNLLPPWHVPECLRKLGTDFGDPRIPVSKCTMLWRGQAFRLPAWNRAQCGIFRKMLCQCSSAASRHSDQKDRGGDLLVDHLGMPCNEIFQPQPFSQMADQQFFGLGRSFLAQPCLCIERTAKNV